MTKLTLSIDDETIELAKRIAKRNGTSVSAMFGNFVRGLNDQKSEFGITIPPGSIAARVRGIIRLPEEKSVRDVLTEALMEKYSIEE